ncbi:MAG TPA: DUF899 family protein [Streptosporangiaceae bacterium]
MGAGRDGHTGVGQVAQDDDPFGLTYAGPALSASLNWTEWIEARRAFLVREKEFGRQREALAGDRRDLPWEEVTKEYVFDGPAGKAALPDLFDGCGQLVVYHFMFPPEDDAGCPHCSFWADSFNGSPAHLGARDTAFAAVSRAPPEELMAYRQRMGWSFPWYSAGETDFNYDFGVSFPAEAVANGTAVYNYGSVPGFEDREGISAFIRDEQGQVFHTYSTYARGIDPVNSAYQLLDLTAKGRDEPSEGNPQFWVRRHDEYGR